MLPGVTLSPAVEETIAGARLALVRGRLTCVELLERCLERIDALEPRVRAWVVVDRDRALASARELDAEASRDQWRGPLHGIPVGIKDIVDVAGLPTSAGAQHAAVRSASRDATIVAELRTAGAVILGKTVTTPYAWVDPPPTSNPWNPARTPGGSSSGSAAALACGMCLGAIGSQTGGSITRPASFCGVAGFKPSHGRLSTAGILPLAPSLDHPGAMARTVADLGILWSALAATEDPEPRIGLAPPPPRFGRPRSLFDERADPAMRDALERALDAFRDSGATVVEARLPGAFESVLGHHHCLMAAEAAAAHQHRFSRHPELYPPRITELINEGLATPAYWYIRVRHHLRWLRAEIASSFDGLDALVTPATIGPAPGRDTTGDPAFNSPWSYTGLPTVSLPVGLSPDGLPLAIQLVGRRHQENDLLSIALWCENVLRN